MKRSWIKSLSGCLRIISRKLKNILPSLLIARILESSVYPSSTIASIQSQKYSLQFSKFSKTFQSSDISNPDSHLGQILCETHIDCPIYGQIIPLLYSLDDFNIIFCKIDRCFSGRFFSFLHVWFSKLIVSWTTI